MTILLTIFISIVVLVASYFVGRIIVEDCDSLFETIFLQTIIGSIMVALLLVVIGLIIYFAYKIALLFPLTF